MPERCFATASVAVSGHCCTWHACCSSVVPLLPPLRARQASRHMVHVPRWCKGPWARPAGLYQVAVAAGPRNCNGNPRLSLHLPGSRTHIEACVPRQLGVSGCSQSAPLGSAAGTVCFLLSASVALHPCGCPKSYQQSSHTPSALQAPACQAIILQDDFDANFLAAMKELYPALQKPS